MSILFDADAEVFGAAKKIDPGSVDGRVDQTLEQLTQFAVSAVIPMIPILED